MNRSVTIEPVKLATYERTVIPTSLNSQNKTQQIDEAIVEVVLPIKP